MILYQKLRNKLKIKIFFLVIFLPFTTIYGNVLFSALPTDIYYDKNSVILGKKLFFDTLLSKNNDISCASCHDNYGADNLPFSIGDAQQKGNINTPTLFNAEFNLSLFWNGRSKTLKEQLLDSPITNKHEMASNKELIESRLNKSSLYKELFKKAYNTQPNYNDMINAIVAFEKTLITPNAKFDRYLKGEVKLSKDENKGLELFISYGCVSCHNGINIGGNSYQTFGTVIAFEEDSIKWPDRYLITKDSSDKNVFRVPSLRNVEKTAPYFHSGHIQSLKNAINVMAYYNLGVILNDSEVESIEIFLKTLTGELPKTWKDTP